MCEAGLLNVFRFIQHSPTSRGSNVSPQRGHPSSLRGIGEETKRGDMSLCKRGGRGMVG